MVRRGREKHFEVGDLQRLGTGPGCVQQASILNRIVTLTKQGLQYEADPRHTELRVRSLGFEDKCGRADTPGVKKPFPAATGDDGDGDNNDNDVPGAEGGWGAGGDRGRWRGPWQSRP